MSETTQALGGVGRHQDVSPLVLDETVVDSPTSAASSKTRDSGQKDWDYLFQGHVFLVLAFSFIAGIGSIALEYGGMAPFQANLLGALWFGATALGYWLSTVRRRLAITFLVLTSAALLLQTVIWWPGGTTAALLVLPTLFATFLLGPLPGLGTAAGSILLISMPAFQSAYPITTGEAYAFVVLAMTIWITGSIVRQTHVALLETLLSYYEQARRQLEEARDHRLRLNQANQDLEDAYAQLRRLTDLLQTSRLEAEAARRAKEEFVANVSHELRTPLNMIIGFSEMILNSPETYDAQLPTTLLSDMRVIHRNSSHLSQLINDVLDLSQVDAGQLNLSRSWVDIGDLVHEALQAIEPLFRKKRLAISAELPQSLPKVYCDRLRIRQVLLNLLSNAGRYTYTGGVDVSVAVSNTRVTFAVRDSGPGISPEDMENIFQPFRQATGRPQGVTDGSGLGLSISRRLVELHGGDMALESAMGFGTTITFSLPMNPPMAGYSSAQRWVHQYSAYEARERGMSVKLPDRRDRVLVLEEQEVLSHQMRMVVGDKADVIRIAGVPDLEDALREAVPSALVVNFADAMADREFSRHLPRLPERVPIVSCHVPGKREAWDVYNVVDYLVKPVTRQQLLSMAAQIIPENGSILVVEDNRSMAQLLRRQLTSAGQGYRVLQAGDGATALRLMRERRPDCVFLDLGLADQDGASVLRVKDSDEVLRPIPVVIVSAQDPVGQPVVAGRLRIELANGLSVRDIVRCTLAVSQAFAPARRSAQSVQSAEQFG